MKVYFDNAATTKLHPKVLEAILPYLKEYFGNPSSIHSFGRKVKVAVEDARETVANFINADPSEIYFTGSGTEANNFPIFGISKTEFNESGRKHIITTKAEHHCVLEAFEELEKQGYSAEYLNVLPDTTLNIPAFLNSVDDGTSLISVMHINNETGSINLISQISKLLDDKNIYFHTDAVQSFGKIKINVREMGVHALSISGHKIGAPKGVGAVFVKNSTPLSPMIFGGSQERNRRGGTENVSGIIGLAEAVKNAENEMDNNLNKAEILNKKFREGISSIDNQGLIVNRSENNLPYILSLTFDSSYYKNDSKSMLMYLDINGVAASNGAACTSGTLNPSHVMLAAGKSEKDANGTIRFSFGAENNLNEVDYTLGVIEKMTQKFRK